jgi:hypothetical protein
LVSPLQEGTPVSEMPTTVLGSGLSVVQFGLVLGLSVALFAFWGGPLWTAPSDASHVVRFAVSYLAVPPLLVGMLLAVRRFNWTRWLTGLGAIWAIKLVATWGLYTALAGGTATTYEPAQSSASPHADAAPAVTGYRAAADVFESGTIRGTVVRDGAPVVGALVAIDHPAAGADPPAGREVDLEIRDGAYARPLYWVSVADELRVTNRDTRLYTVHLHGEGGTASNQPAPANTAGVPLTIPEPGLYTARSDGEVAAETRLLVVDHPYVAITDETGAFEIALVPLGATRLYAVAVDRDQLTRSGATVQVAGASVAQVEIDVGGS